MMKLRLLLIDDHAVVRKGYRRWLDAEPDLIVVGEAATAAEARAIAAHTPADLALIDLSLKGSSGLEAIASLRARHPSLKLVVLSMHDSVGHVQQALKAGADAYLTKHCEPEWLVAAVRRVAQGERVLSPDIDAASLSLREAPVDQRDTLTPREFEVLRQRVRGQTPQQIAAALHLSPKTVLNCLTLIRQKLQVDDDVMLMHRAVAMGVVTWG